MTALPRKASGCDDLAADAAPVSVKRAVEISTGLVDPVAEAEDVAIHQAHGRYLAADMSARRAMPLFDNSAMDGFAVCLSELRGAGPWRLKVNGTAAAGSSPLPFVPVAGTALRIFTGAQIPAGYDAVAMQEDCRDHGGTVTILALPAVGENIRRAGEDVAEGAPLLAAGTRLEARHVGLLAGNGYASVTVRRRPRIAVLSTGNELIDGGEGAASIADANRPMLLALCQGLGATVTDLGVCADDLDAMTDLLRMQAGRFEMIITSGAASVGGKDFMQAALLAAGGSVAFWKVALKPGKPVFFGRLGGTLLTGLPGNPLASYVGFQLFAARQIAIMLGVKPLEIVETAVAGFDWKRKPGREEYIPARIAGADPSGRPIVEPLGQGRSASLFPLAQADGMIVLDALSVTGGRGTPVGWIAFAGTDLAWTIR